MKNIKVGDKVRCITDMYVWFTKGKEYKVQDIVNNIIVEVIDDEGSFDHCLYSGEYEPITKTLDNLEVGDVLEQEGQIYRIVEAVCGNLVGFALEYEVFWVTIETLKKDGWKLKEELEPKVKKAIKLLEEKGYKVEK